MNQYCVLQQPMKTNDVYSVGLAIVRADYVVYGSQWQRVVFMGSYEDAQAYVKERTE